MNLEEAFYFTAIVAVGLTQVYRPARNATAVAMVATWFACRLLYSFTGHLPLQALVLSDMAVIAAMFVKEEWCECPYRGWLHQIACTWIERTPWDKGILAMFPLAWLFYAPIVGPQPQYWTLYGIGLAQLMLAGREAFHNWQRTKAKSSRADAPGQGPGTFFAPVWGRIDA